MRPTLARVFVLVLSFAVGVMFSLAVARFSQHATSQLQQVVHADVPHKAYCGPAESVVPRSNVVISVPADDEFYLGKRKVSFWEIRPEVMKMISAEPTCNRRVYVKSGATVRFETLAAIST